MQNIVHWNDIVFKRYILTDRVVGYIVRAIRSFKEEILALVEIIYQTTRTERGATLAKYSDNRKFSYPARFYRERN